MRLDYIAAGKILLAALRSILPAASEAQLSGAVTVWARNRRCERARRDFENLGRIQSRGDAHTLHHLRSYVIDIDYPQVQWLPESEEEKQALMISSFRHNNTPPGVREPRKMPIDQLVRPFLSWQGFLPIEIPLEYYRRGAADMAKAHYLEAIYDFYFVIEFLFADGKFHKHAVREAI